MDNLENENKILKAKLDNAIQQSAVLIWAVFFASFTAVSLFVWLYKDKFSVEGIFEIEVMCTAFASGIALLVSGLLKQILFGDVMKDYPDEEMPKIDKNKDSLMIFLLVVCVYAIQFIGYFIFGRL